MREQVCKCECGAVWRTVVQKTNVYRQDGSVSGTRAVAGTGCPTCGKVDAIIESALVPAGRGLRNEPLPAQPNDVITKVTPAGGGA